MTREVVPLFDLDDRLLGHSHRVVVTVLDRMFTATGVRFGVPYVPVPGPSLWARGFVSENKPWDRCTEYSWFEPADDY